MTASILKKLHFEEQKRKKKRRRLHTAGANTEDEFPLSKSIQKLSKRIKQGFLNDYIMQNLLNWNPLLKAKLGEIFLKKIHSLFSIE